MLEYDFTYYDGSIYYHTPISVQKTGVTDTMGQIWDFLNAQHPDVDRIIYFDENNISYAITYSGDPDGNYVPPSLFDLQVRAYGLPSYPATISCMTGTYDPHATFLMPKVASRNIGIPFDPPVPIANTDDLTAYLESLGWFGFYYRVYSSIDDNTYRYDERNNPADIAIMYSADAEALYGLPTDLVTLAPLDSIFLQFDAALAPGPDYGLPTTHDPVLWRRY